MTCIIGLAQDGKVYLAGDSAGMAGYKVQVRSDCKVFKNGPFIMGFTSSFRMGQLLRYNLTPPSHPEGTDDMKFMVAQFIPAVRTCMKDGGFLKKTSEVESGGSFLVGYRGQLYEIDDDFQVGQTHDNIAAIGCGGSYGLGAMHALNSLAPEERILKSIQIVEKLNCGVRGPFTVISS